MVNDKINVGVLFGGKSAEHEISLRSAKNVIEALDKTRFNPVLIGITQEGKWMYSDQSPILVQKENSDDYIINPKSQHVAMTPQSGGTLSALEEKITLNKIDVVFPILHGPFGEDGTIQGLLKLANVPFVGAGVLGSAVGMDKDIMKRLLIEAGLNIGDYLTIRAHENRPSFETIEKKLGMPCFVKPANLGSSVGITKVESKEFYEEALDEAFSFDRKIVIESLIEGREIECAVLGNEYPKASVPGEITFSHSFYSYEAKYQDDKGYKIEIPAVLNEEQIKKVQEVAIKTFQTLECEGFGRIDVFLTKEDRIVVNEINTIPGFTKISMYPKLWEASGLSYSKLISNLIDLALDRFEKEKSIRSSID
ncbi:MAG: D-alanine--D-alanine ligase [Reichenbachiella sp.]